MIRQGSALFIANLLLLNEPSFASNFQSSLPHSVCFSPRSAAAEQQSSTPSGQSSGAWDCSASGPGCFPAPSLSSHTGTEGGELENATHRMPKRSLLQGTLQNTTAGHSGVSCPKLSLPDEGVNTQVGVRKGPCLCPCCTLSIEAVIRNEYRLMD